MQLTHSKSNAITHKYGDSENFAKTFNPDLQRVCASNIERTFAGDAPTVGALLKTYSESQVRTWIMAQFINLNTYSGAKNKMNPDQMMMLSDIVMTEYFYLKASELLLFFFQFKSGKFGELYGSVDPLRLSSALIEFVAYRRDMIFRIEQKQQEEQKRKDEEMRNKTAITWEEYLIKKSDRK